MSRWTAIGAVVAAATALVSAGCSHKCGYVPGSCPSATFDLRALDGNVTWTYQGAAPATAARLVPAPAPAGACSFTFEKGNVQEFNGDAMLSGGYGNLTCNGGDAGRFEVDISELGDFRSWSLGTFTITPSTRNFGVDLIGARTSCNYADYPGIPFNVTVETATGGAAPYPKMVTSDFVRTFRLDFDTTGISPTKYDSADACDFPVVVGPVSLHLAQTAADYRYDATASCPCE